MKPYLMTTITQHADADDLKGEELTDIELSEGEWELIHIALERLADPCERHSKEARKLAKEIEQYVLRYLPERAAELDWERRSGANA